MKFIDFNEIFIFLGTSAFFRDLGGPGHLKNINIPIGISTFSAWGRPEPSKSLEEWFLPKIY